MEVEFNLPKEKSSSIKVIGVGGAGSNAVNYMHKKGIKGVSFIVANTDDQHLQMSLVPNKILLGQESLGGEGTGGEPNKGRLAAEESIDLVREVLSHNTKMLFIAAGMGKGTGTGGSPVIARKAKEMGILTVAIVTTPMTFLGKQPMIKANEGLAALKDTVDAYIVIDNDKIVEMFPDCGQTEAFAYGDDILANAAKGIAEIITGAGIHNTDFNDVKNVLTDGGMTIMGIGYAQGENRAFDAVDKALKSPLLSDYNIHGATKALVNISYSSSHECTMKELKNILGAINAAAESDMEIMYGTAVDDTLEEELAVTIVVTGFNELKKPQTIEVQKQELPREEVKNEIEVADLNNANINEDSEAIIVESNKQVVIQFGSMKQEADDLFENQITQDNDGIILLEESDEVSNLNSFGSNNHPFKNFGFDDRRKKIREMELNVKSPLNNMDNLPFNLPENKEHQSSMMLTNDPNDLFKNNHRIEPKIC